MDNNILSETKVSDAQQEASKENSRKALITGVTGQDGSYLTEFLIDKGYEVHGLVRRSATDCTENMKNFQYHPNFTLHYGDMTDSDSLNKIVAISQPTEVYNLAAQSHVGISFSTPVDTMNITGLGAIRLLEAVRQHAPGARFYQASTSELFGSETMKHGAKQNEDTPFQPASPYGVAKLMAYHAVKNYRETYGMFAVNGILFNHESPRRSDNFVTQKIVKAFVRRDLLKLGNLDSVRDWGHAKDFVRGMWMMLQHDTPEDFVLATGETHTVRELVERIYKRYREMEIRWEGSGTREKGVSKLTGEILVEIDEQFYRPNDVGYLCGDATKAKEVLGWEPEHSFQILIEDMISAGIYGEE